MHATHSNRGAKPPVRPGFVVSNATIGFNSKSFQKAAQLTAMARFISSDFLQLHLEFGQFELFRQLGRSGSDRSKLFMLSILGISLTL
jgi:hypothetical protein